MKTFAYAAVLVLLFGATQFTAAQNAPSELALRQSAQEGDVQAVKALLDARVNINARDEHGQTVLHWVAPARDNPEMAKLLIARGADVNAQDNDGETALMIAASQSNPKILVVLLEAGADVNARNKKGETALMAAAFRANLEEIKILLAHGADAKLQDGQGRLAVDIARVGSKNYTDSENEKRFAEAVRMLAVN